MADKAAFIQLREQAIALRRAGKSRREIKELLAITSNWTLTEVLRGYPPQPWTWRPNAKDELRAKARGLREQGLDYEEIVAELGVSKRSVSLWVRDLPRPPGLRYEGMPQEVRGGRPQVLGVRTTHPGGRTRGSPCRSRRPDRPTQRPRDHHRRSDRLLVRRREKQAVPPKRPGQLHEQRSEADQILLAVPRGGRHYPESADLPCLHPRECRHRRSATILA